MQTIKQPTPGTTLAEVTRVILRIAQAMTSAF
jgi:hypothetical protein